MTRKFKNRALKRSIVAYFLLSLALLLIFFGIFLVIDQIQAFANATKGQTNPVLIDRLNYYYTFVLIVFLAMLFFISQTLLRLYRYNMLKSDFYLACADALILSQDFNSFQSKNFDMLLTSLLSEKTSLTIPKSPTFSIIQSKDKKEG